MLVSVIVTTYKREYSVLKRAIESVLDQTHPNIEIIVVNDTPSEHPLFSKVSESIKEYGERVHYIAPGVNQGANAARNAGFLQSSGAFIAFLDDDDYWDTSKIAQQVHVLTTGNYPMVTVGFERIVLNKSGDVKKRILQVDERSIITLNRLLRKNIVGGCSAPLIRREAFIEAGQFDVDLPASQDYDLWIRIAKLGDIYFIDQPLLKYFSYQGERISNNSYHKITGYRTLLRKYSELAGGNRKFFINKHIILAYHLFKVGEKEEGREHYVMSFRSGAATLDFWYYSLKIVKNQFSHPAVKRKGPVA